MHCYLTELPNGLLHLVTPLLRKLQGLTHLLGLVGAPDLSPPLLVPLPTPGYIHLGCLSPPNSCVLPLLRTSHPLTYRRRVLPSQELIQPSGNFLCCRGSHSPATPGHTACPPMCVFPKWVISTEGQAHTFISYSHHCLPPSTAFCAQHTLSPLQPGSYPARNRCCRCRSPTDPCGQGGQPIKVKARTGRPANPEPVPSPPDTSLHDLQRGSSSQATGCTGPRDRKQPYQ